MFVVVVCLRNERQIVSILCVLRNAWVKTRLRYTEKLARVLKQLRKLRLTSLVHLPRSVLPRGMLGGVGGRYSLEEVVIPSLSIVT